MAEISQESGGNKKGKKKRTKKASTTIDFTPMVDLGFLLITFFMLTTTLSKPQTMEIVVPAKDKVEEQDQPKVNIKQAITILLDKDDKVFYYFGARDEEAQTDPQLVLSDYSSKGIRQMLLSRNANVVQKIKELKDKKEKTKMKDEEYKKQASEIRNDREAPVVMIKAVEKSKFRNLVDALDEMQICNIGKYAIVDITPYDTTLIYNYNNPTNQ